MKVWPIDPLVPRNLRLEVPEKLPQGLMYRIRVFTKYCTSFADINAFGLNRLHA
jgi:hypothetical protein